MARTRLVSHCVDAALTSLGRFLNGRRGGVMVLGAILMVPLLGFVGIAADSARGYMVRARLAQALDSAGLAAGKWAFDQTKAQEEANMVFTANFPPGYMDSTLTGPTFTFTSVSTGNDLITVSASAALPTYFVHLLGIDNFTVSASTEVTRKTVYMDVVISIDVSGSMDELINGVKKIDAARAAAHTLVDSLFGASETKDLLKMGLVTWNSNARILPIGQTYNPALTTSQAITTYANPHKTPGGGYYSGQGNPPYPSAATFSTVYFAAGSPIPLMTLPPANWKGCVMARFTRDNIVNDGDTVLNVGTVNGKAWMSWHPAPTTHQCTNQGTQRLVNVKATIKSAIDLVINPSNNTSLGVGLVWGWRLLGTSDGPYAGDGTPPPTPDQGELVRALVLMTDGANTQSNQDAYNGTRTAAQLDARTQTVATNIKNAGIIVYAIQFGFNNSTQEALMKSIASGPTAPYYQYAPDAAALTAAFQEIGNSLSKLRLSK